MPTSKIWELTNHFVEQLLLVPAIENEVYGKGVLLYDETSQRVV